MAAPFTNPLEMAAAAMSSQEFPPPPGTRMEEYILHPPLRTAKEFRAACKVVDNHLAASRAEKKTNIQAAVEHTAAAVAAAASYFGEQDVLTMQVTISHLANLYARAHRAGLTGPTLDAALKYGLFIFPGVLKCAPWVGAPCAAVSAMVAVMLDANIGMSRVSVELGHRAASVAAWGGLQDCQWKPEGAPKKLLVPFRKKDGLAVMSLTATSRAPVSPRAASPRAASPRARASAAASRSRTPQRARSRTPQRAPRRPSAAASRR